MLASTPATRMFLKKAVLQGAKTTARALGTQASSSIWTPSPALSSFQAKQPSFQYYQQKVWKSTVAADTAKAESRDTYNVSQTLKGTDACKKIGLDKIGITGPTTIHRNLTYQELFEHEKANNEGVVAKAEYGDTFLVSTGKYTGRSPKDKWVVYNEGSQSAENFDWNDINQATTPEVFEELNEKAVEFFNSLDRAYVFDCYVGASPKSRKKIRFVRESSL